VTLHIVTWWNWLNLSLEIHVFLLSCIVEFIRVFLCSINDIRFVVYLITPSCLCVFWKGIQRIFINTWAQQTDACHHVWIPRSGEPLLHVFLWPVLLNLWCKFSVVFISRMQFSIYLPDHVVPHSFDAVGWVTGRASCL